MSQINKKNIRIQSRVDTPENWEALNPILLEREIGYETNGRYKIGDGKINEQGEIEGTPWNDLEYTIPSELQVFNGKNPGLVPGTSNYDSNLYLAGDGTWKEIKLNFSTGATIIIDNVIEGSTVSVIGKVDNEDTSLTGYSVNNVWSFPIPNYGDWTVNIECVGQIITKQINVTEDKNYIITGVYDNFEENSWDIIIAACQDRNFRNPWTVGSKKSMFIKDSIDSETGKDYQIMIIGKNHDEYTDGEEVYDETFKDYVTTGNGKYAPLTFQIYESIGNYPIDDPSSDNDYGSWHTCYMRKTILPKLKELLPENIQNAIRNVCKPTETFMYATKSKKGIRTYLEDLFLLSKTEIMNEYELSSRSDGKTNYLYAGTQYEYYANGNNDLTTIGWTRTHNCSDVDTTTDYYDFIYVTWSSNGGFKENSKLKRNSAETRFAFCF